jgi:HrpA-like RNA helicase
MKKRFSRQFQSSSSNPPGKSSRGKFSRPSKSRFNPKLDDLVGNFSNCLEVADSQDPITLSSFTSANLRTKFNSGSNPQRSDKSKRHRLHKPTPTYTLEKNNSTLAFDYQPAKIIPAESIGRPDTTLKPNLSLPVLAYEKQIKDLIRHRSVAIIIGQTGSGKTTEIGRMMSEVFNELGITGKIAITQPRRPAAVSIAEYVASKRNQTVGQDVGYHIRFNDTTNRGTILDYVTDGILIEQLLATKTLLDYGGVILDEAHIRNLNMDFLIGLILRVNRLRSDQGVPPLKILITSATIPAEQFSQFFHHAPVLEIPGRMFPVQVLYEPTVPDDYIHSIAHKVKLVLRQGLPGDILIFVPGEAEIRQTISTINRLGIKDVELLPFFGQQSLKEQDKVFATYPRRKIVVATNIAETSLTIDGVRIVIDSGLQRSSIFDHKTGISRLQDEWASQAAIDQRKGRAGRTAPGVCYRLYPANLVRPTYDVPEILRTDLASTVLKMKKLGIDDVLRFDFLDKPKTKNILQAIRTLQILGALDEEENITSIGKIMANLPLDPHISRMVVEADRFGCVDPICTIAGFMSSKSVFDRNDPTSGLGPNEIEAIHRYFKLDDQLKPQSDYQTFLKIWSHYESQPDPDQAAQWAVQNFLNLKVLQEVELIRKDLLSTLQRHGIQPGNSRDPIQIAKCITAGTIGNLLEKVGREEYRKLYGYGQGITIHPSSALRLSSLPRYLVAGEIMTNASGFTGAFQCQAVEPEWIPEVGGHLLRAEVISWKYNPKTDQVEENTNYYLKNTGRHFTTLAQPTDNLPRAAQIFAQYLVDWPVSRKNHRIPLDILENLEKIPTALTQLIIRNGGPIPELAENPVQTKLYQIFHLHRITSVQSLLQAIKTGLISLNFQLTDFLPASKIDKIEQANPLYIQLAGQSIPINYYLQKNKFMARMDISAELFTQITKPLSFPNRPPSHIKVKITGTKHSQVFTMDKFEQALEFAQEQTTL